jgi:hypothetical protein
MLRQKKLECLSSKIFHISLAFAGNTINHIHNTSFSSQPNNEPDRLVLHYSRLEILARDKHASLLAHL